MKSSNPKTEVLTPNGQDDFRGRRSDELSSAIESLAYAQKRIAGLSSLPVIDIAQGIDLCGEMRRFEKKLIESALRYTNGSQVRAASLLKIKPSTLNYKIARYQIK
ncbi:MAG: helix-turn-helix domain-containing protein [Acidobacteria bacterium]|nr:helix-turn-helix domain-containing protein [Acidobacteriota bacterium]